MAQLDYDEQRFYDHIIAIRCAIEDYEAWCKKYLEQREFYPTWKTKEGRELKIQDITDSHLENLIPFVLKRDPNNQTHWFDAFKREKYYRQLCKEIKDLKAEYKYMQHKTL